MEYGTGEDMAHTCSAQHIEQHGPAPSDSRPRRYSKAERQAFGALVNASVPAQPVAVVGIGGAVMPEKRHCAPRPATTATTARTARKTLGWMMAASAAADITDAIAHAADTAHLRNQTGWLAAATSTARTGDTSTISRHLPPDCGPVRPVGRQRRTATPAPPRTPDRAAHATLAQPTPPPAKAGGGGAPSRAAHAPPAPPQPPPTTAGGGGAPDRTAHGRHVVMAAAHVDTSTYYQTADGRIHLRLLPSLIVSNSTWIC